MEPVGEEEEYESYKDQRTRLLYKRKYVRKLLRIKYLKAVAIVVLYLAINCLLIDITHIYLKYRFDMEPGEFMFFIDGVICFILLLFLLKYSKNLEEMFGIEDDGVSKDVIDSLTSAIKMNKVWSKISDKRQKEEERPPFVEAKK